MCCSSAELDLCLTILCQLLGRSMASITEQCDRIRRGGLLPVNSLYCWSIMSFCSWTKQHLMAIVVCKIWFVAGAGGCWHNLPTLPVYFFLARVKENALGEGFASADDTNTALTASLLRLSKDEYGAAVDRLPHTW